ncbi:unnamed protein product [Protopolystoma xenopodis]|uniref:Uncharacterized protein n=1 Tax=Protopolystoma xenopodis TaxID=117903 RepID=A0A3S5AEA4_9PLAT|nr:unnamed protein product [Protopolystoma xenopodis]
METASFVIANQLTPFRGLCQSTYQQRLNGPIQTEMYEEEKGEEMLASAMVSSTVGPSNSELAVYWGAVQDDIKSVELVFEEIDRIRRSGWNIDVEYIIPGKLTHTWSFVLVF